jgi:sirohydrochlorin cobaltochelatase
VTGSEAADEWLPELPCAIGEILLRENSSGGFLLSHLDDSGRDDLVPHVTAEAAAEIARYDDAGNYRPLKTAPNLRHGWSLSLTDQSQLRLAIDLFYPGRLAAFVAWRKAALTTTPFRETLGRQTGMYRVASKISDAQADELIGNFCRSDGGCLRTILWRRDAAGTTPSRVLPPEKFDPAHDQTGRSGRAIPLLCQETCNLVVAAAREVMKRSE